MERHEVERQHLIFNLVIILTAFILDWLLFSFLKEDMLGLIFYFLGLIFLPTMMIFGITGILYLITQDNGFYREKIKNPLGVGDLYLSSTAIVTILIINDLIKLGKDPVLSILIGAVMYYLVYKFLTKLRVIEKIFSIY